MGTEKNACEVEASSGDGGEMWREILLNNRAQILSFPSKVQKSFPRRYRLPDQLLLAEVGPSTKKKARKKGGKG